MLILALSTAEKWTIASTIATFLLALFAAWSVGQVALDRRAARVPNLEDPQHNPGHECFEVVNIGGGPAVNCIYIGNMDLGG